MYVNPFWMGVLVTIGIEIVLVLAGSLSIYLRGKQDE